MTIPKRLKRFGDRLRSVLGTDESYGVVGHLVEDWNEGGCAIVAKAIKPIIEKRFGAPVRLSAVIGVVTIDDNRKADMVGHVLAEVDGVLFDANGAHTPKEVISEAKRQEYVRPRLVPFESMRLPNEDPEYQAEVFCPIDLIRDLTKFLKSSL